jgi:hypothetical protein
MIAVPLLFSNSAEPGVLPILLEQNETVKRSNVTIEIGKIIFFMPKEFIGPGIYLTLKLVNFIIPEY